ncbi:MAG: nucleoside hydrolase [bacterium]|nr:nucleoside hydrolase [bacterium]
MSRKVIIDCDPGVDDAIALCLAMFDPRLDVTLISAVAGGVTATQATCNVQAVVEQLDPPRLPRIGAAVELENAPAANKSHLYGDDGLGGANFVVSQLHHRHPAEKLISDVIRANPDEVTILTLGPLTNIAAAFRRDPSIVSLVDQVMILGGTMSGSGDATAAAEFNMFFDPAAAEEVFASPTTKTLVPLELTQQVSFTLGLMDEIPDSLNRVGAFLHRLLPRYFRAHHEQLGIESIELAGPIALCMLLHPELFETEAVACDIETHGRLTIGATVIDRRRNRRARPNVSIANSIDAASARDCVVRGLQAAGEQSGSI